MRAKPQNLRPSSPVPSDDKMSVSYSKKLRRLNNGGNPGKKFLSDSSITAIKGRKDLNNNNNVQIRSTPQHAAFWDSDSSDDELVKKFSNKSPDN